MLWLRRPLPVGMRSNCLSRGGTMLSFAVRAVISILSGIGAGLLGFCAVWRCLVGSLWDQLPGSGYDGWLLAGIFIPGVLVPFIVFRSLSQAADDLTLRADSRTI